MNYLVPQTSFYTKEKKMKAYKRMEAFNFAMGSDLISFMSLLALAFSHKYSKQCLLALMSQ